MIRALISIIAIASAAACGSLWAQAARSAPAGEERIIAVLPLIGGGGGKSDRLRPALFPADGTLPKGILSYQAEISDDGKSAIIDIRGENRAAFQFLLESKLPGVRVFEPHRNSKEEVEREIQGLKRGLTLGDLKGGRP